MKKIFLLIMLIYTCLSLVNATERITSNDLKNIDILNLASPENVNATELKIKLFDFDLTARKFKYTTQGLFIEEGFITILGSERFVKNLGLSTSDDLVVWSNGTIECNFEADTGYGKNVLVNSAIINTNGIFCSITVPVNENLFIDSEVKTIIFDTVQLNSLNELKGLIPFSQLKISSYNADLFDLVFTGSEIQVLKVVVNTMHDLTMQQIELKNLSFDYLKIKKAPKAEGVFKYSFSGWNLCFQELLLDENGLGGEAFILLPPSLRNYVINFPSSRISASGLFTSGKIGTYNYISVFTWKVSLENAQFVIEGNNYKLSCPNSLLSLAFIAGPELKFGRTVLNSKGEVENCEPGNKDVSFISANNYRVKSNSYQLTKDGIFLQGSLACRKWPEDIAVDIEDKGIKLLTEGSVLGVCKSKKVKYSYANWNIIGENINFNYDHILINTNFVTCDNSNIPFSLGKMVYNTYGELTYQDSDKIVDTTLEWFSERFKIIKTKFSSEGLTVNIIVSLPKVLGGNYIAFDNVVLHQNGDFSTVEYNKRLSFDIGSASYSLDKISLSKQGFSISEFKMTFANELENQHLYIIGLTISQDGQFNLGGGYINPMRLWNMWLQFTNISIVEGMISLDGYVNLPSSLPHPLGDETLKIQSFRILNTGYVKEFEASLQESYSIPITDNITLIFDSVRVAYTKLDLNNPKEISQPWVLFDNGSLNYSSDLYLEDCKTAKIAFNPLNGTFDFSRIKQVADVSITRCGVVFTLNNILIDKNISAHFKGNVVFPNTGVPDFIKGKTLIIEDFEIKRNGKLGNVILNKNNFNGTISKDLTSVLVSNVKLSFIMNQNTWLSLTFTGDIVCTKSAPKEHIAKVYPLKNFVFNMETGKISAFDVDLSKAAVKTDFFVNKQKLESLKF